MMVSTGPKISSCAIRMRFSAWSNTAGAAFSRSASAKMMLGDFPPRLERHARDVGRRQLEDGDAGRGLAGKGDLVDTRMAGQRAARAATRAGDHVEHARREAGLERDSPQL